MLKKMLVASSCMVALATGAFAEKLTKTPVDLEIYGKANSVYKQQNNWRAGLLDATDRFAAAGIDAPGRDLRHGANNRESQNVRMTGELTMVARAGANEYQGTNWYNMIAVMQLKLEPKDPDNSFKADGAQLDYVQTGDAWVRYAPHAAVGFKVGVQTVAATAPAANIGHIYVGDPDSDFVFYTVTALDEKPGVTVDVHLSKDIEFGIGQLQGMGDFSAILSGGKAEQATANVAWFKGNFGIVEAALGYQTVSVGGLSDDGGIPKVWQKKYNHTMINYSIKGKIGNFSPYYSIQQASGEKTDANPFASTNVSLKKNGMTVLNNNTSGNEAEATLTTVGILANLGDWGKIAADYTTISDSSWGEEKSMWLATELDYATHFNWEYKITDGSTVTLFYNFLATKDDAKLRADIQTMQNNVATATALGVTGDTLKDLKTMETLLESIPLSYTESMGIQFSMAFGN